MQALIAPLHRCAAERVQLHRCVGRDPTDPYPSSPEGPSGADATPRRRQRGVWERDDAYPCIARDGDVRVIECKDRIQWVWQRRRKSGRWADLGYFRNRDVLIERSGLDLPELRALPPYHEGAAP